MSDKRTYIRVHDGMDEHPKIEPLSDKAFRVLMTTWFWCSRNKTDGRVPETSWVRRGTKKVRDELVNAGLVEVHGEYVLMHDYLQHQRSVDQIDAAIEKKRLGGVMGNHRRWHVNGYVDPECDFCKAPDRPPKRSHIRSDMRSVTDEGAAAEIGNLSEKSSALATKVSIGNDVQIDATGRQDSASASGYAISGHRITDPEPIGYSDTEDRGQRTEEEPTPVGIAPHDSNVRDERLPPGASGPTGVEAFRLVRRTLGLNFPAATCTALAYHAADLLKQFDEETVTEALAEWRDRTGIGPGVLPSLVADVVKHRSGTSRARLAVVKPSTTDTRMASIQALKHTQTALPGA